ncbi:unnamed protein product [Didymodactylos carnosus]|uniref:LITAF domain-containing protein n=1 Tax=Didymodactylos carnosus TaxID=1234261 RepID=A0A815YUQ0_9BILA|nr:unnamed protein product [Didymodactylos carnosus]CAF4440706.1 unnamed protein product [Didymodactylos carnosus]
MSREQQIPLSEAPPLYVEKIDGPVSALEVPQNSSFQSPLPPPSQKFRDIPVQAYCPSCGQTGLTQLDYVNGLLVWSAVLLLILFGFIFGCCLIPFCVKPMKDRKHLCKNCGTTIGYYRKLESVFGY